MTSEQFRDACQHNVMGDLWDDSFNLDYQESVTLTIKEMRFILNVMLKHEGKTPEAPKDFIAIALEEEKNEKRTPPINQP